MEKSKALRFGINKGREKKNEISECVWFCIPMYLRLLVSMIEKKCLKLLEMQTVSSALFPLF